MSKIYNIGDLVLVPSKGVEHPIFIIDKIVHEFKRKDFYTLLVVYTIPSKYKNLFLEPELISILHPEPFP